jgi:hypothetical protein
MIILSEAKNPFHAGKYDPLLAQDNICPLFSLRKKLLRMVGLGEQKGGGAGSRKLGDRSGDFVSG